MTTREGCIIETPQRTELAEYWEGMIDEVLVCSRKIIVDDPVEVAFLGCELDIDPVRVRVNNGGRRPAEVRSSAVYKKLLVPRE
jgi:hypothetical protein